MKPRLLDLYAGAGGAARGYQQAGFYVVGVDNKPQPHYAGDEFVQADALEVLRGDWPPYPSGDPSGHYHEIYYQLRRQVDLRRFDAIHASPPCQRYSLIARNTGVAGNHPDLVAATRELLVATGLPYVIENVKGSPLINPVKINGGSLGLGSGDMDLPRERHFELSFPFNGLIPPPSRQRRHSMGVYGHGTNAWHREKIGRNLRVAEMREAMGIDWMNRNELSQAIPPAYTELIGAQLLQHIQSERAA
ncbi:MAG: DNA cytosine methyltransferase [Bacteroidales bacterium]|nr:DNA cytosine methyltransferase [Bacteroidales bacterium]